MSSDTSSFMYVDDRRIWVIAEALRRGISYEEIHDITKIDYLVHR